jgi:site-specific recombinase XerD
VLLPLRRGTGYCFLNRKGNQFGDTELTREFKRVVAQPSGLPDFTLHTLRHTFASHLAMRGVSIYKVSQWLGHKSVNTTMIYAHLAPQDDEINVL